jgi:hypothetical protein
MKSKLIPVSVLAVIALVALPSAPASAHEYRHRHGVPIIGGLFAAGVAVGGAAVAIATAPVRILANAATQPYPVAPQPYATPVYYAAPAPVYAYGPYGAPYGYAPAPVIYQQPVYRYP